MITRLDSKIGWQPMRDAEGSKGGCAQRIRHPYFRGEGKDDRLKKVASALPPLRERIELCEG